MNIIVRPHMKGIPLLHLEKSRCRMVRRACEISDIVAITWGIKICHRSLNENVEYAIENKKA